MNRWTKGFCFALACSAASAFSADWWELASMSSVSTSSTDQTDTSVTLTAKGADVWNKSDSAGFFWAPAQGDCEVFATIPPLKKEGDNANIGNYAKVGVMFRKSTIYSSPTVFFCRETSKASTSGDTTTYSNNCRFLYRSSDAANMASTRDITDAWNPEKSVRLRIVKKGTTFTAYWKPADDDSAAWTLFASRTMSEEFSSDGLQAGICLCPQSGSASITITATDFDVRQLVRTAPGASAITISWDAEQPDLPGNATVTGFNVYRTSIDTGIRSLLHIADASATEYSDTSAVTGERYVYDVEAAYEIPGETEEAEAVSATLAIGASLDTRIALETANTVASTLKGMANQYFRDGELIGSLAYQGNTWNPWENGKNNGNIYPANDNTIAVGAGFGETGAVNFRMQSRSILRFPTSGFWRCRAKFDDYGIIKLDGKTIFASKSYADNGFSSTPVWVEAGRNYFLEYEYANLSGGAYFEITFTPCNAAGGKYWVNNTGFKVEPIPAPWSLYDMGKPAKLGNAAYDNASMRFTVNASGRGFTGAYDEGQHVWMDAPETDFEFIARVTPASADTDAQAGIVLRSEARSETAPEAGLFLVGNELRIVTRATDGEPAETTALALDSVPASLVLRLARQGTKLACYYLDGNASSLQNWTQVADEIELPQALRTAGNLGFAAASGDNNSLATAVFDRISVLDVPDINPAITLLTESDGSVRLYTSVASKEADYAEKAAAIYNGIQNGYFWTSDITAPYASFNVGVHSGIPTDEPSKTIAENVSFGTALPYAFESDDLRALEFFTMTPVAYVLGDTINPALQKVTTFGIARQQPTETGTGIGQVYSKSWQSGPVSTSGNVLVVGAAAFPDWDRTRDGSLVVNGTTIGTELFWGMYLGYLTAPYSGYYRFKITADDLFGFYLDGKSINGDLHAYNASDPESIPLTRITDWIYLKAGEPLPVSALYSAIGSNRAVNKLQILWENGAGTGGFTPIPVTALSSSLTKETPTIPDNSSETSIAHFGEWNDLQWESDMRGITIMERIAPEKPYDLEKLNLSFASCSSGANSISGHLLYREFDPNADFTIRASVSGCNGYQKNARNGLYVAASTKQSAPSLSIERLRYDQSTIYVRNRAEEAGTIQTTQVAVDNSSYEMHDVEIIRRGEWLRAYVDGELVKSVNVSGWKDPIVVGFVGYSQAAEHAVVTSFHHAEVGYLPPRPTMFMIN